MKKFLIAVSILSLMTTAHAVETKRVCHDVKQKNGKVVNQCKTIKVHQMYHGTKVPEPVKKPAQKTAKKK